MSGVAIPNHLLRHLGSEMKMDTHWIDVLLRDGRCVSNLVVRGCSRITGRANDPDGEGDLSFTSGDIANIRRHHLLGRFWPLWPKQKLPRPHSDLERRLLSDVAAHGCHVIKVLRSESTPPFAYSIGLFHNFGHPEVLLVGLDLDLMHRLINDIRDHIRAGVHFSADSRSSAILRDLDCEFRSVAPAHYPNLFGRATWFYRGDDFPAVQCVWPDRQGRFPGQPDFDPSFRDVQPTYERIA